MAILVTLLAVSGSFIAGCTAHIVPPPILQQMRTVYLLDHGFHTSLVLRTSDQQLVRWAYGDWSWYAEGDRRVRRVLPVLLRSTSGTLGRQAIGPSGGGDDLAWIQRQVPMPIRAIIVIPVEAVRVDQLQSRQEQRFAAGLDRGWIERPETGLVFVPDPAPYHWSRNSNHEVAVWLEALGCRVEGTPTFGAWRLATH
ncbi:hypothetical protein CKO25_12300 [Thiocapsa imhoffii]|uniref:DUF2459 domain-containing protein n=1 Tax=Thiocapsa imhoffii TaxID=382777 RepID=A0A9X1B9V4_9GAMM|nr:hypothetical protein [Thiocapsa imhoffii]MBK1645411.1 hypothetical protein [Thiocapsa imhoffii]